MTTQAFEYPQRADALVADLTEENAELHDLIDAQSSVIESLNDELPRDLQEQINDAFMSMRLARNRLHDAQTSTAIAQAAFDDCKRDMFLGGHVIGKNETEREAKLQDLLRVQTKQLRDAQHAERTARLYFDIARDEVERVKLLAALVGE